MTRSRQCPLIAGLILSLLLVGCSDGGTSDPTPAGEVEFTGEAGIVVRDGRPVAEHTYLIINGLATDLHYTALVEPWTIRDDDGNEHVIAWVGLPIAPEPFAEVVEAGGSMPLTWSWDGTVLGPDDAPTPAPAGRYTVTRRLEYRVDPDQEPTRELACEVTFDWPGP
ncbi:MAG: hypothetical protein IH621_12280 [Krumholzibacteria bacterium]|nr:hypothetical protein [Candidatus Krumholzibacteria bacterium]